MYEEYLNEHLEEVETHDITDIPINIQSMCYHRYFLIKNMKYRYLAIHISLIYQMFEQFILSLSKHQQKFISYDIEINNLELKNIHDGIKMLKKYNLDIKKMPEYQKINELRLLNNVIKHGDGDSKKKLERIRPDIFANSGIYVYNNTIIDDTLDISKNDLNIYIESIKKLLHHFPDKIVHEYYI